TGGVGQGVRAGLRKPLQRAGGRCDLRRGVGRVLRTFGGRGRALLAFARGGRDRLARLLARRDAAGWAGRGRVSNPGEGPLAPLARGRAAVHARSGGGRGLPPLPDAPRPRRIPPTGGAEAGGADDGSGGAGARALLPARRRARRLKARRRSGPREENRARSQACWACCATRRARRLIFRRAVFAFSTPLLLALSIRLVAWRRSSVAAATSPCSSAFSTFLVAVRTVERMAALRWRRFSEVRTRFSAERVLGTVQS